MNAETIIRKHAALRRLPDREIRELARLSEVQAHPRGQTLLSLGRPMASFLVIGSGLAVTVTDPGGAHEMVVAMHHPGESPHELPVDATQESTTEARVFTGGAVIASMPTGAVLAAVESHGAAAMAMAHEMSRRASLAQARAGRILHTAEERLAMTLLELCAHFGDELGNGHVIIPLRIFRHDLAGMVGTTDETVIRTFKRWNQQRLVASTLQSITVLDPEALAALATFGAQRARTPAAIA